MAHVLLVMEEPGQITLVGIMLQRAGHTVTKVRSVQAALDAIGEQHFDLVFLDAHFKDIPYQQYREMAQTIIDADPTLPVVLYRLLREGAFADMNFKAILSFPILHHQLGAVVDQHARPAVEF